MDSVLIFADTPSADLALVELAREKGVRYKSCSSEESLCEWLGMRTFSALLLPASIAEKDQRNYAQLLWEKSPSAHCVVYDLEQGAQQNAGMARLNGLSLYQGEHALRDLGELFERMLQATELAQSDFKVMIVEDLDSPRDIICAFVESIGYRGVIGKSSASDALKELESNPDAVSCIITDIQMPKINGVEFIDIVRHHKKLQHIPIVVLTAYGTIDVLVDSLQAGASGFLVKPPKKADLVRELSRAARIKSGKESPRLASHNEAEQIRRIIEEQGLV